MNQSKRTENLPLGRLIANAVSELKRLEYSARSQRRYQKVWSALIEFARENKLADEFSGILADRFVDHHGISEKASDSPAEQSSRTIKMAVEVLADLAQHGRIERARIDIEGVHLCPASKKVLIEYEKYARDRLHLSPVTIHSYIRQLTIFLDYLSSRNRTVDHIQALDLSEFLCFRRHLRPRTISRIVSDIRSFLRFLTVRGILHRDLSAELPIIRVARDAHIPSVWDNELLLKLLAAVDRSSAKGKRDYAILLLACRLGLRAGDIRTLKLDNIHWEDSRIDIIQSKTGSPLSLPLTEEVGQALIDYLGSGRPKTAHREVFLKMDFPFDPFARNNNLHDIVRYWRQLAGIRFKSARRQGIHSLRHTLATRLLEQGTPFPTIADILGHNSLETTRIYAKADVEALRDVALDPEEVKHGK